MCAKIVVIDLHQEHKLCYNKIGRWMFRMYLWEKVKCWFDKNKKYILIGAAGLAAVGAGVVYIMYKGKKISFEDWLKIASDKELNEAYEKLRLTEYLKTGTKSYVMEQLDREMSERMPKNPPHPDINFRWTDANRWDRD